MVNCNFCMMVDGKLPANKVYEDGEFLAIKDIHPKAPVHILIIPKKHFDSINAVGDHLGDIDLMGKMMVLAKTIAKKEGVNASGYRLIINTGEDARQEVDHLHMHLLGGKPLQGFGF